MTKTPKALKAAPREPCRRDAAFVAWMLRIMPDDVFPCGPDTTPEGDDHLILFVALKIDALAERFHVEDDGSEAFAAYRRRVVMCANVMSGKLAAPPQSQWNRMAEQYGRGACLTAVAHLRRGPRT